MAVKRILILLCLYSIFAIATSDITERLSRIEDRLRHERILRQESFKILNQEIDGIKLFFQDGVENTSVPHNFLTNLAEKLKTIMEGVKEEKIEDRKLRQKIPAIEKLVQELNRKSDDISASLINFENETESIKEWIEKSELKITKNYTLIQKEVQKIRESVEKVQLSLVIDEGSLDNMTTDILELKEKVKTMQQIQEQSILNTSITNDLVASLQEKLSSCTSTKNITDDKSESNTQDPTTVVSTTSPTQTPLIRNKSCLDLFYNERKTSHVDGVYDINAGQTGTISVYCDMTTDGGGWTVFQRRQDGSADFFRDWNDYKTGFGNLTGEFWLGNEYLHLLTDNDEPHELRIELEDHDGNRAYAKYSTFVVGSESTNYQLQVSGYTGNAGDSLETSCRGQLYEHDSMEFSTLDRDNDKSNGSCAVDFKGGWWYNSCFESNLNSLYHNQPVCSKPWVCIVWNTWKGSWYSLKSTEMKFR